MHLQLATLAMTEEESLHNQILDDSIEIEKPDDCNVSTELLWDDSSSNKVKIIMIQPDTAN